MGIGVGPVGDRPAVVDDDPARLEACGLVHGSEDLADGRDHGVDAAAEGGDHDAIDGGGNGVDAVVDAAHDRGDGVPDDDGGRAELRGSLGAA